MSNTTNKKIRVIEILVVLVCIGSILAQKASALTMSNDNYILQWGDINAGGGESTGASGKLTSTIGQTAPGLYTGTNYKVRAGFQYIHSTIRFAFSISETSIDFGSLSPTNPVTRTNTLTVSNNSSSGYTVTVSENHPLQSAGNVSIPDTTCDNGLCTETTASPWTATLTYGFGYRCDNVLGTECVSDFTDPTYYKQFPDASKNESEATVMSSTSVARNKRSQITYKVNISGTQAAGTYSNGITYIATPTF